MKAKSIKKYRNLKIVTSKKNASSKICTINPSPYAFPFLFFYYSLQHLSLKTRTLKTLPDLGPYTDIDISLQARG